MVRPGEGVPAESMNAPIPSRQFPSPLNEPLARLLLRPKIFMNPEWEFPIGAWATPQGAIDPAMRKIVVTNHPRAKFGPPTPVESGR
jgi:hypothetical protein